MGNGDSSNKIIGGEVGQEVDSGTNPGYKIVSAFVEAFVKMVDNDTRPTTQGSLEEGESS